jgi:hypothetical protein
MTLTLDHYAAGMTDSRHWLGRVEAAELLDVAPQTVDRYARLPQDNPLHLPRYRTGNKRPRYRVEDVEELIRRRDAVQPDTRQG